jgi:nitric oxide synthase-interacting protein
MKKEAEVEVVKAKQAARERVLVDFEKGQLFANPAAGTTTSGADSQEGTFSYPLLTVIC